MRVLAQECLLDHPMSPILKAIAGVLGTPSLSSDTRVAHLAELKGEEAGEDVPVLVERKWNPRGNLDLSDSGDDDKRIEVAVDVTPYLEVPRRGFGGPGRAGPKTGERDSTVARNYP